MLLLCVISQHLGVKSAVTFRAIMGFSVFISSCVYAHVNFCVVYNTDVKWRGWPCGDTHERTHSHSPFYPSPPSFPRPLCLWTLLAQACLSIFVTGVKFDVSYFQLTASEPCMNELVIYTKCLIKSAAAPGINIVERLGIFTGRVWGFAQRCLLGYHTRLPLRVKCHSVSG